MKETVLVLDLGGQYKELIARSVRELNVYSEIKSGLITAEEIKKISPIGIILTGGPNSIYKKNSPKCDINIFHLGIPILGICYGMQLMCYMLGGEVTNNTKGEYGKTKATLSKQSELFKNIQSSNYVLMSHNDCVQKLPPEFTTTAQTENCTYAACENSTKKLYAVQFHPETEQTENGIIMLKNFLFNICKASGNYKLDDYIDKQIKQIRQKVGKEKILLALSGGVDSAVAAKLLSKAIPGQLICIFVDHGFLRYNEGEEVEDSFKNEELNFIRINAQERFLSKIKNITTPEQKRKIIGEEFARIFEEEARKLENINYLAQGTIYPDIIESGNETSAIIKSHHNVGGLPTKISFKEIIEPLAGLFKNEVRKLGEKLNIPDTLLKRQPFPGPGLAIRIIGEVTKEKLEILRTADHILCQEISKIQDKPQQYFAILTNVRSVGVKGDDRTYDYVIAIRAVTTSDFMTCEYTPLPHTLLSHISSRIVNETKEISRVVYDITNKPPSTIEWE